MSENNTYGFRTAVGGFHKGDVCNYIANLASTHQAEVSKLQNRLAALFTENETLRAQLAQAVAAPKPAPEPAEAAPTVPQAIVPVQPQEVLPAPQESLQPFPDGSLEARELAAYRRAEAAERLACQRAGKLYTQIQAICDDSAKHFEGLDTDTQAAMDAIYQQMEQLLRSLSATYDSIHASSQALKDMSVMLPDPAEGLEPAELELEVAAPETLEPEALEPEALEPEEFDPEDLELEFEESEDDEPEAEE